ncbi:MAG: hypothetical protein ACK420_00575 [Sphingomonadales bacterium]
MQNKSAHARYHIIDRLLQELPEQSRQELSIEYGFASPLHGLIDVVIRKGGQCMALRRFRPVAD